MKDVEVTIRIHNNQIKERRVSLGMTQGQLDKAIGFGNGTICQYENLYNPLASNKDDVWKKSAIALANFFQVTPEDLWPIDILQIKDHVATRAIDVPELQMLSSHNEMMALPPHEIIENAHDAELLDEALKILTPREEMVIRKHFGLHEDGEHNYTEIAKEMEVGKGRVSQIVRKALCKLRYSSVSNKLAAEETFDCWAELGIDSSTMDRDMVRWAARTQLQKLETFLKLAAWRDKGKIEGNIRNIKRAKKAALSEISLKTRVLE